MRIDLKRLRRARESRLLTQAELAELVGLGAATINRIENGRQSPRLSTIRKLAEALGVEPGSLIADDEDDERTD